MHEGRFLGAGISHLLEHMVFKGTEKFDSETLSQTVQSAGGQWNAYTTFDRTVYYIDGPSEGRPTFLDVLLEMVFKPTFPEGEFEKEKGVIRREIDMGLDDPDSVSSRQLFDTAFGNDDRRQPVIGHLDLFNKLTREDMLEYHRTRYTTENAFICISGDIHKAEVLKELEELTESIGRSFTHPAVPATEPEQQGLREATEHFAVPVSKFSMAWQVPSLEHADSAAIDLACTILGSGRSSRLYQNIREKRQLCLHIGAWSYLPTKSPGVVTVSAEVEPDGIEALEKAIVEEILHLLSGELDKELAKAKRMTLVSQFRTLTTASGRASDLASNWHESRNLNFTRDYMSKVDAVTIHDIRRVVESYMLGEKTLTKTIIHPEAYKTEEEVKDAADFVDREIIEKTLENGLRIRLCKDSRTPLVSFNAAVKTGLPSESEHSAGLNTLLATMLTKGTKVRSAEEIAETIESLGASLNASAGNNTTILSGSCLMADTDTVLELFADCLIRPYFSSDIIEREKELQLNAIEEADMDPASLAFKNLRASMFGSSGYGLSNAGTKETVEKLERMQVSVQHKLHFKAANMVVSVFGDIEPEYILGLAEKYLSRLPEGGEVEVPIQQILEPEEKVLQLDKQQGVLTLGYVGCGLTDPDRYALGLINAWCSDMAGPLFSRIREELGLAYYVSSTMFHGFDTGMFAFYMGTSPEQLELAQKELIETIARIAKEGMTEVELTNVKTSWLAKQALTNQSNGAMAGLCSIDSLLGLGSAHFRETAAVIKKLEVADIKRVAKRFFADQKPTVVVVKP